jgi:proteasome lid subunit RPN8/RPN11
LRIEARHLDAILAHARAGHPFEVCGVLLGRTGAAGVVVTQAVAVANQERAAPRVRYEIAPEELLRLQREARAAGRDVVGFYHSHPDHPARPSETDRRMAAEGLSDGVVHLVVGVDGDGHTVPSAWVFHDAAQAFGEEPLLVVRPVLEAGRGRE